MSANRWEPFRDMITLREAMDRFIGENYRPVGWRATTMPICQLPIDVYVTDEDVVITAAVAGVDPEKVEITLEGDTLTIKGEITGPLENVDYLLQERAFGTFSRTLRLNIPVQADKAEASFDKGVLTLTIPKQEEVRTKTIKVSTKE
ncbi:MAG: Hsp20/alpha crystallin family protein [Chloroflexi bacterium]|nr:Hsp20/alpha crystallin family protein [Chloroflexota bacterium]